MVIIMIIIMERIQWLVERNQITLYRMAKDLGFSTSKVSAWKQKGTLPTSDALVKIADYFDVSLDYLVGRSDTPDRVR